MENIEELWILNDREWAVTTRNPQHDLHSMLLRGVLRALAVGRHGSRFSRVSRRAFLNVAAKITGTFIVTSPLDLNGRTADDRDVSAILRGPELRRRDIPLAHKYILDDISFGDDGGWHLEVLVNFGGPGFHLLFCDDVNKIFRLLKLGELTENSLIGFCRGFKAFIELSTAVLVGCDCH